MNKTSLLFLLGAIGPLGSAYAMSVDIESKVEDSEILLGRINNELATNYVGDKLIELKWVTKEGKTISTKPYLIPNSSMKDIRFCVSSEQTATCSTSWSTSHALRSASSPKFTAGNTANLTVRVLDNDSLKYEEPATSISNFDIISGRFGFHYTEQLDQHGHVVMNMISYSQPSIFLTLPSIESNMKTIKACSVGGFYLDEPTYIESCTPSYEIDSSPVEPEPEESVLCLYQHPNYKGNKKCFDEEEINHSKDMTSPKFPHSMANYGLVDSSSLTIKSGYRATVGNFSGHNSTINDTWNKSATYLGNTVGDKGKHVFLERDDTYGCFFQHHALHYGEFERAISQCVEVGEKIEQLTPLKSGLQRTLSTITMHPGLTITLYSDLGGNSKLGTYNQARFWTGSGYPNDRAKSFSISVDKNYSFYLVNGNTLLRSLENSSLALKNLITEKGDLHLVTSDGHWTRNFVLPEGVPEFTRLKFERKSTYHFNVVNGDTTYTPKRGETLVVTYINNQWVLSGDKSGSEVTWSSVLGVKSNNAATQSVSSSKVLYIRAGAAIDAIGTSRSNLHGGSGGGLYQVSLTGLKSVTATRGDFRWGGRQLVALTFHYQNGSQKLIGSKRYATNRTEQSAAVPAGQEVKGLNVWSNGWLVSGLQLKFGD
ncbi:beta-prism lectin domain-containing protein [Vibrio sp. La 4.2.2]|uniref:beta-prism lectin domain-containing protein n=1 Tax=Vibrio sp. La 4.2.2 TaxID=2998830 RepID=UPI0022CDE306|nr:beta-prism lectin domain-containing protein [Vibrio sp. La 4.2.2]